MSTLPYREIIELRSVGLSFEKVAFLCGCSTTKASAVSRRAAELGLGWPVPVELSDDELVAVELDGALDGAGDSIGGATGQSLLKLIGRLAQLSLQVFHAGGNLIHTALERSGGGVDERQTVGHVVEGTLRGHGLDTADIGARGGLGNDLEQANLGGIGGMGATTELAGERLVLGAHGDDADDIAVLLSKQSGQP